MIRGAVLLCLVLAVALGARSFLPDDAEITGSGATLAVGLMLLASLQAGHVTEALKLPHVTAYILAGILIGPDVLGLLTPAMLEDLSVVKSVAVGLIALLAGCELNLRALAPRLKEIGLLSVSGLLGGFFALFAALFAVSYLLPFGDGMSPVERGMVALVCANAMCAFSPPVVIGILTEARSKGPMSELWISIVVLADIAIVLSFSMTSSVAHVVLGGSSEPGQLLGVLAHILGSLVVGAVVGPILALYIDRIGERVGLFVFAALFVIAQAGVPLHVDPLLVGLTAGLFLENMSPVSGHRVIEETEAGSLPTFAVFFALIGAEIHLADFMAVAPFALLLAVSRAGGLFGGVLALGRVSGADERTRQLVPFGMLPQAGIAIALATAIKGTFQPWGPQVATLLLGTIVVNELIGPVVFRLAVGRSGEAGHRHDHPLAEHAPHAPVEASASPQR